MNDTDKKQFFEVLSATGELYDKGVTKTQAKIYFEALRHLTLEQFNQAVQDHIRNTEHGRFFPKPADILREIEDASGFPSADEAWSIAVQAIDENASVVWTDEIANAWGIAASVMPDRTGARMAFRSAYERNVELAKRQGKVAKWWGSLGHDQTARDGVINNALNNGLLTNEQASMYIEHKPTPQGEKALQNLKLKLLNG